MKRPDKYPVIDPRLPDLYGRILTAANAMRRARRLEDEVERMMTRVRLAAAATARAKLEEAEPVSKIILIDPVPTGSNPAESTATA